MCVCVGWVGVDELCEYVEIFRVSKWQWNLKFLYPQKPPKMLTFGGKILSNTEQIRKNIFTLTCAYIRKQIIFLFVKMGMFVGHVPETARNNGSLNVIGERRCPTCCDMSQLRR